MNCVYKKCSSESVCVCVYQRNIVLCVLLLNKTTDYMSKETLMKDNEPSGYILSGKGVTFSFSPFSLLLPPALRLQKLERDCNIQFQATFSLALNNAQWYFDRGKTNLYLILFFNEQKFSKMSFYTFPLGKKKLLKTMTGPNVMVLRMCAPKCPSS